jgi:hypothetical protein
MTEMMIPETEGKLDSKKKKGKEPVMITLKNRIIVL